MCRAKKKSHPGGIFFGNKAYSKGNTIREEPPGKEPGKFEKHKKAGQYLKERDKYKPRTAEWNRLNELYLAQLARQTHEQQHDEFVLV